MVRPTPTRLPTKNSLCPVGQHILAFYTKCVTPVVLGCCHIFALAPSSARNNESRKPICTWLSLKFLIGERNPFCPDAAVDSETVNTVHGGCYQDLLVYQSETVL